MGDQSNSDERLLAGIAHLGAIISWGIIVSLIIFIVQKDRSSFVRSHAKQALGYQLALIALGIIMSFIMVTMFAGGAILGNIMDSFGAPLHMFGFAGGATFMGLGFLVLKGYAVYAAVKAFTGEDFRYVIFGDFIDRI